MRPVLRGRVLPLTREWIEIVVARYCRKIGRVLPLTREWIEMGEKYELGNFADVLPLTREWIEMMLYPVAFARSACSPSYEGVD